MCVVRFVLLGLLAVYVGVSGYLLRHRDRYGRLLENGFVNLALVLLYNCLCYLIVGLPSGQNVLSLPAFFTHPTVRTGLSVLGQALIVGGVMLLLITVMRSGCL